GEAADEKPERALARRPGTPAEHGAGDARECHQQFHRDDHRGPASAGASTERTPRPISTAPRTCDPRAIAPMIPGGSFIDPPWARSYATFATINPVGLQKDRPGERAGSYTPLPIFGRGKLWKRFDSFPRSNCVERDRAVTSRLHRLVHGAVSSD